MRRVAIWVGLAATLLAASVARADILKFSTGAQRGGTLKEVTFVVDGAHHIYRRGDILVILLSDDGKDTLERQDGTRLEGKLVSVTFRSAAGMLAVGRKKLKAVVLDAATMLKEEPQEKKPPKESTPEPKLSPEELEAQKEALAENKKLYKAYLDEVEKKKEQEKQALRSRYMGDARRIAREISRLENSINAKLRRREEARRRRSSSRYGDDYDRLLRTDGLEKDRRALAQAKRNRTKLKKVIDGEQDKIAAREKSAKRRVRAAYVKIHKSLKSGKLLTEEQMTRRFQAVLEVEAAARKKSKKKDK